MSSEVSTSPGSGEDIPSYCQVLRFKDANGQVKEMIFPKALDLDRPKRPRTTFSESQLNTLETEFQKGQYLIGRDRTRLAESLGLSETQIKVWFQNRRTKSKRDKPDGQPDDISSSEPADPESHKVSVEDLDSNNLPSDPTPAKNGLKSESRSRETSEEDIEEGQPTKKHKMNSVQDPADTDYETPPSALDHNSKRPNDVPPAAFFHPGLATSNANLFAALSQQGAGNLVGTPNEIGLLQPKMDPSTFGFLTPTGAFKPVVCPNGGIGFQPTTQTSSALSLMTQSSQSPMGHLPYPQFHPTLFSNPWMFK